ncbi:MAG TPA: hypothetical protein VGD45_20500 [Steroidobacter sp.]|uniref:hypothetical protein n=1 Tax=Steroidobacter sp. TaxID=1978227 RepID=UPI002EDB10CA
MNQRRERIAITQSEFDVLALIIGHVQQYNRCWVVDLDMKRTAGTSTPGDLMINAMTFGHEPRSHA